MSRNMKTRYYPGCRTPRTGETPVSHKATPRSAQRCVRGWLKCYDLTPTRRSHGTNFDNCVCHGVCRDIDGGGILGLAGIGGLGVGLATGAPAGGSPVSYTHL